MNDRPLPFVHGLLATLKFALTTQVATLNSDQRLLLTVNDAATPVALELAAGRNVLRVLRPSGGDR